MNVAPAIARPGLDQEGDQRTHHENRLEPLAQEQDERLKEEVDRRRAVGGQSLRALQDRIQCTLGPLEFGAAGFRGLPERREGRLGLARETGISGPHLPLDALEHQVGVERGLPGLLMPALARQVECGRHGAAHRIEYRAGLARVGGHET